MKQVCKITMYLVDTLCRIIDIIVSCVGFILQCPKCSNL